MRKYFDIYEFHFFLYNITGYGYLDFKSKLHKLFYSIYHLTLIIILVFNNAIFMYVTYSSMTDVKEKLYDLTVMMTTAGCSIKIFLMDFYRYEVKDLHKKLNNYLNIKRLRQADWVKEIEEDTEQLFIFISKGFLMSVWAAILVFISLPLMVPGKRELPYQFPIKNLNSPYYETVYVIQSMITILFILNTVSYDMVCCGFLLRLSSHFKIISASFDRFAEEYPSLDYSRYVPGYCDFEKTYALIKRGSLRNVERFNNFMEDKFYNESVTRNCLKFLEDNFRHYQEITRQLSKVNAIFSGGLFIQIAGGPIVFCIAASVAFSDNFDWLRDFRLGMYAIVGFVDLLLFCWCGSHLLSSAEMMERSLYALPWYEMHPKTRRLIMFTLMKIQKAKGLVVGDVFRIDLNLFVKLIRFAHSFIAILKEV